MLERHLVFCIKFAKLGGRGREGIWTEAVTEKSTLKSCRAEGGFARSLSVDRMSVLLKLLLVRATPCINYNFGLYMNFK